MATPLFHANLTVQTKSHDYPIIITEDSNAISPKKSSRLRLWYQNFEAGLLGNCSFFYNFSKQ